GVRGFHLTGVPTCALPIFPPSSMSRRQRYSRLGATPLRRATTEMLARSSSVSSTIRSFSAAVQRRRRPPSVMISISDISTCSGICPSLQGYAQVSGRNGGQFTKASGFRGLPRQIVRFRGLKKAAAPVQQKRVRRSAPRRVGDNPQDRRETAPLTRPPVVGP